MISWRVKHQQLHAYCALDSCFMVPSLMRPHKTLPGAPELAQFYHPHANSDIREHASLQSMKIPDEMVHPARLTMSALGWYLCSQVVLYWASFWPR